MGKYKNTLEGPPIVIQKTLGRFDIVKTVVNHFIEFEKDKKGKGVTFKYPVERLSIGGFLYIRRPGIKWNFDFKVEIPPHCGLEEGRHDQIAWFLRRLKEDIGDNKLFSQIWNIIVDLYHCINNDVDEMVSKIRLKKRLNVLVVPLDVPLKVIKWLFIMEDIVYWHYEGRAFLYNFIKYATFEEDEETLNKVVNKIRQRKLKPEQLKKILKARGITWEVA